MRRATVEQVIVFWDEDSQPCGMLYENGHREIYQVKKARKQDVLEILGAQIPWQEKGLIPAVIPGGDNPGDSAGGTGL